MRNLRICNEPHQVISPEGYGAHRRLQRKAKRRRKCGYWKTTRFRGRNLLREEMVSPSDKYKRKRPLDLAMNDRQLYIQEQNENHEWSLDRMIANEEAEDTGDADEDLAEPINCKS